MKAMGIWMEVTTLLIPGLNDDRNEILRLLSFLRELDANIPWHVSRFFPQHQLLTLPATSIDSIHEVLQLGVDQGLKFLYSGNIADSHWNDTRCPQCRETLIKRSGYNVENIGIKEEIVGFAEPKYLEFGNNKIYLHQKPGRKFICMIDKKSQVLYVIPGVAHDRNEI